MPGSGGVPREAHQAPVEGAEDAAHQLSGGSVVDVQGYYCRGHGPILSRDPLRKPSEPQGEQLVCKKNDDRKGKIINP